MRGYQEYMDQIKVSDALHEKLLGLEGPARRPVWKYSVAVAALALVVGLGGLGAARAAGVESWDDLRALVRGLPEDGWKAMAWSFDPNAATATADAEAEADVPDIALEDPGDAALYGRDATKSAGGYEVRGAEAGPDTMVGYFMLPWIDYQELSGTVAADYSLVPPDGGLRDAGIEDILAVLGCNEDALADHLNWGGCTLTGTVGLNADGSAARMYIFGESDRLWFEAELCPGQMPPQCCINMDQDCATTDVWGVEVTGIKDVGMRGDGERGIYLDVSRRAEFLAHDVGVRFTAYGVEAGAVEELISRFVRWAVVEGLDLSRLTSSGVLPPVAQSSANPYELDPTYGVDEDGGEEWTQPSDSASVPPASDTGEDGLTTQTIACDG